MYGVFYTFMLAMARCFQRSNMKCEPKNYFWNKVLCRLSQLCHNDTVGEKIIKKESRMNRIIFVLRTAQRCAKYSKNCFKYKYKYFSKINR